MRVIVDASVAVKWFLLEPLSETARDLLDSEATLAAPDLVLPEIANVLWKRELTGGITGDQVAAAAAALPIFFDEFVSSVRLMARALEIARALDHPAYDCFYLAAAEEPDTRFVTDDVRLLRRLTGSAWAANATALQDWTAR